jgi:hypothetical protein
VPPTATAARSMNGEPAARHRAGRRPIQGRSRARTAAGRGADQVAGRAADTAERTTDLRPEGRGCPTASSWGEGSSVRARHLDVSVHEVVALEEQRLGARDSERGREAVTEV